jgi:hypothetical protein
MGACDLLARDDDLAFCFQGGKKYLARRDLGHPTFV